MTLAKQGLRLLAALPLAALPLAIALHPVQAAEPDARLAPCLACHGEAGQSSQPLTPSLGGQPSFFVVTQLFLYREARRDNPVMIELAKAMTDTDLRAYAEGISKLAPPAPPAAEPDAARYARGESLSAQHKCNVCHTADLSGQQQVPRLANQREDYLLKAMREFKSGQRKGYGGAMAVELMPLDDGGLVDLAHYMAHYRAAGKP